jgi:transcriptional regulator with XRE-family HTH domain
MYGKILRSLRIDNGLTQQQLAEILGFKSSSAIGMLEREERELSVETIIRAANYFNVPTDYLLGLVPFKNETEAKVLMKVKHLLDLEDAELTLKFILSQPVMSDYLKYDLKDLSDGELLKMVEYMLFAAKLRLEELKSKIQKTSQRGI